MPVDVVSSMSVRMIVAGMIMMCVMIMVVLIRMRVLVQRFRVQPAADIGRFLIRIVEADIEKRGRRRFAARRIKLNSGWIERLEAMMQPHEACIACGQKIALADHQPVGHRRLFDRFGVPVERRRAVQRIDEGDDTVEAKPQHEIGMIHDRMQHRRRVGETGGLDDHAIERRDAIVVALTQQILQRRDQIATNRAAEAAGRHDDDIAIDLFDKEMIEPDLAEFIDEHQAISEFRRAKQLIEQRRLTGPEKAGEDRQWKDRRPARVRHYRNPARFRGPNGPGKGSSRKR